jgi:SAM-dependent methyltransferase
MEPVSGEVPVRHLDSITPADIISTYSGPESQMWELLMGEQIHINGLPSSMRLAERAGIRPGTCGVDLCCYKGCGMRFLVRFRDVAAMTGVDITPTAIEAGRAATEREGFAERIRLVLADACNSGLPSGIVDFVWGEDAWCYVPQKDRLIAEAVRLVKPGGTIAFTDWVEGRVPLSGEEAGRFLKFMKFPSLASVEDYRRLLERNGCRIKCAEDTGQFAPCVDLYMSMLQRQAGYDALRILGFQGDVLEGLAAEFSFTQQLAHEGKLIQGLFVAQKP